VADRTLFLGWDRPVAGREERGLEVFNEAIGFYGRMQQEGRIESFNVVLLRPNGGLNGYMELVGNGSQLAAVEDDEEFRRLVIDANLVVENLQVTNGFCNEGIAQQMGLYTEAISKVPQQA
jgi:hypothetical protein